jgi:hypothetical protein
MKEEIKKVNDFRKELISYLKKVYDVTNEEAQSMISSNDCFVEYLIAKTIGTVLYEVFKPIVEEEVMATLHSKEW